MNKTSIVGSIPKDCSEGAVFEGSLWVHFFLSINLS